MNKHKKYKHCNTYLQFSAYLNLLIGAISKSGVVNEIELVMMVLKF